MKKIASLLVSVSLAVMTLTAANLNRPSRATAVTQVFGDGITFTGIALEYPENVTDKEVSDADFKVPERTLTGVSVNDKIAMDGSCAEGRYVILHLSPTDSTALLKAMGPQRGGGPKNGAKPGAGGNSGIGIDMKMMPNNFDPFLPAKASVTLSSGRTIETSGQVNLIVDDFKQATFTDSVTGNKLMYNIFVPDDVESLGSVNPVARSESSGDF